MRLFQNFQSNERKTVDKPTPLGFQESGCVGGGDPLTAKQAEGGHEFGCPALQMSEASATVDYYSRVELSYSKAV